VSCELLAIEAERNEALFRALGYIEGSEDPAEPEGLPDFDGGVRESAPSSSNPESDHNELLLNLLQEHKGEALSTSGRWHPRVHRLLTLVRHPRARTGGRAACERATAAVPSFGTPPGLGGEAISPLFG
jgi:hypothetical protein